MSKEKIITPKGTIKFPRVETVFDPKTETSVKKFTLALVLDPKESGVSDFLKMIDNKVGGSKYPKTKPVYKDDKDKCEGELDANGDQVYADNGKIIMNFRSNYPINFFDSMKKPIKDLEMLGWGSIAKVSFELAEIDQYKCLTKYIKGVQILDLKEAGTSADSCGFDEEEGFTTEESSEAWE